MQNFCNIVKEMRTSLKMTEYKCPRCGYTSDRRSSMTTHLSRKKNM